MVQGNTLRYRRATDAGTSVDKMSGARLAGASGERFADSPGVFTANQSRLFAALALMTGSFVLLYWQVIAKLVHDWGINDNYSHGYLIPPLAAYLPGNNDVTRWRRRRRRGRWPASSSRRSVCRSRRLLGAELFLSRIAFSVTLVGAILFVWDGVT